VGGDDVVMDLLVMHTEITLLQIVGNQVMVLFVVPERRWINNADNAF
jgi:hypothetical protein